VSLGATRSKPSGESAINGGAGNTFTYGIEGSQLLFDGGKAYFMTKGADSLYKKALYVKMETSATVRLNLRLAFIKLLSDKEQIDIAKEICERREKNLNLVRIRYNAGRENRGSLMTAEVNLEQARFHLVQAERSFALSRNELAYRMGLKERNEFTISGSLVIPRVTSTMPDFMSIARRTPGVMQAEVQAEYADYERKSAAADYSPRVAVNAGASRTGSSWPPEETIWSAGVTVTLPILEGGARIYENSKSQAFYRQALSDLESARHTAEITLAQKWMTLLNAIDTCRIKEKSLRASEERAKIAEARYNIGVIGFDNWIIIENELVDARKNYLTAKSDALDAEAEWYKSNGVTLDHDVH
jgi:outer membrane protein TolC